MEVTYFDREGNQFTPTNATIADHKGNFSGAFLNMNTTVFSEDDNIVYNESENTPMIEPWHDVRGENNVSVFMDNENMSVYLRLDDCESGKRKFVSVTLDENEIEQLMNFMNNVSTLNGNEE